LNLIFHELGHHYDAACEKPSRTASSVTRKPGMTPVELPRALAGLCFAWILHPRARTGFWRPWRRVEKPGPRPRGAEYDRSSRGQPGLSRADPDRRSV